jgi:hypothetical protein
MKVGALRKWVGTFTVWYFIDDVYYGNPFCGAQPVSKGKYVVFWLRPRRLLFINNVLPPYIVLKKTRSDRLQNRIVAADVASFQPHPKNLALAIESCLATEVGNRTSQKSPMTVASLATVFIQRCVCFDQDS